MGKLGLFLLMLTLAGGAAASWYWPFGSDDGDPKPTRRLSELMEPASHLIDEASDLAADGKTQESVEKYRAALAQLDAIEMENPERAASAEFATLRNKRAYVNAAIDSLLLSQVRSNAKSVAVSDTTALEKRLADERKAKAEAAKPKAAAKAETVAEKPAPTAEQAAEEEAEPVAEEPKPVAKKAAEPAVAKAEAPAAPLSPREQVLADIDAGRFEAAAAGIGEMLVETPNGAMALNLKAMMESAQGRLKDAESTLDQAILSNPRSHFAYYNMAALILQADATEKKKARRYYETGRAVGGPPDPQLEEALR